MLKIIERDDIAFAELVFSIEVSCSTGKIAFGIVYQRNIKKAMLL